MNRGQEKSGAHLCRGVLLLYGSRGQAMPEMEVVGRGEAGTAGS